MQRIFFSFLLSLLLHEGSAQHRSFVMATYTYSGNNRLSNLRPLARWLEEQTGDTFRVISYPTVQRLSEALVNDSVDIAFMNTAGYLVLNRNFPGIARPVLNLSMGASTPETNYAGCLIISKQSNPGSVTALKEGSADRLLSLVNPSSSSGNLVPRLLLNAAGIPEPEKVFNVRYTGNHRKVVEQVLSGQAFAGGCGCAEVDSARKYLAFDSQAIVLASYNNIPLGPVLINTRTDPGLVSRLLPLLLNISHLAPGIFRNFCQGWTEFRAARTFVAVDDRHYDPFREMFGNNELLWKMIE